MVGAGGGYLRVRAGGRGVVCRHTRADPPSKRKLLHNWVEKIPHNWVVLLGGQRKLRHDWVVNCYVVLANLKIRMVGAGERNARVWAGRRGLVRRHPRADPPMVQVLESP